MGFLGVYRALYDYVPQAQGELAIQEGDVLYVLEKDGGDGWWKAKKKAGVEDEEEPEGLVPHNYVDEAPALCHARALYEYTRQTDEELSFPEDALLDVFDTSDPDWILVGLDDEFGFVPANYIEMSEAVDDHAATPANPALPARPASIPSASSGASEAVNAAAPPAAAALASVLAGRAAGAPDSPVSPPAMPSRSRPVHDERVSDDESMRSPALPSRPRPSAEPSHSRYEAPVEEEPSAEVRRAPGGFHMYNINEMVSVMGKRKKMPTTLGINLGTGVILIAPERASDGPSQEWTADRMTHYSREGKHVFMELVRPSKSVDFHAGAKDTAEEIVAALGEMAGAVRAEGLKEVIMAGTQSGKKRGQVLYDFMAQGEDEVTVAIGDEVIVVDDSKSEEWWQVRRIKNGKEGVVPSSYIEITGVTSPAPAQVPSSSTTTRSTVEQNRLEEVRLTKEALKASKEPQEVGPGMTLPERGSSLSAREHGNDSSQQRSRRENGRSEGANKSKSKPDSSKVRTWTDRSRSFSVEAQFLGLKDGKIHLHKMNGVKIAVPITKMSREDLEYIENATGISLEDEKPLADVKKSRPSGKVEKTPSPDRGGPSGAAVDKKPEYDWFQFFLDCDVAVGLCERYAQAFIKDSMDESVLPDVDGNVLRQLGLREGDIIKVMRHLDSRYGRNKRSGDGDSESGGLFSGPGGALRNNTRKGRPAPAVQTSDVVDAKAFSSKDAAEESKTEPKSPPVVAKPTNGIPSKAATSGFDDDAWDVKPSKQQLPARAVSASPSTSGPSAPPQQPALTGSMHELSLLTAPLQPSRTEPPPAMTNNTAPKMDQSQPPAPQQPEGATPSFFSSVSPQAAARQRPQPPQTSPLQGGLVPPPPRPLSAPQSAQPSAYAAPPQMAPQMTGALQGRPAPPGQSLNDLTQARLQQQYLATMQQQQQQQQPMMTGYMGQQMQPLNPMFTGAPTQFMQPMMTGSVGPSPFADPGRPSQFSPIQSQPTGFQPSFTGAQTGFPQQAPPGGINSYLPPALEPQRTGMPGIQPQPTGMSTFSQQSAPQPLQPQKTGPAPPVRFGVPADANKLTPQATGRRANLSQATPQNPFGF